jgi:uncharacterized membrane protein
MVHAGVLERIRADRPDWSPPMPVCTPCLRKYRAAYVEHVLAQDRGELSALEAEVVTSLREHDLLARDVDARFEERASVGQRLADRVATFGGSWTFLVGFGVVLCLWVALNSVRLFQPFDPYPFILLNLVLSCIAALQAPIIMMSQNRQEAKDRLRSENDYRINLKAELEIRHLQAKLDQLLTRQWQRLIEIQQLQTAMIEDLQKHRRAE